MFWRLRADNFFNTTISSQINDSDVVWQFSIQNKTVNWYTLEDGEYVFWMLVWISNQDELEIFRIYEVDWTTLKFDKRISPNGLHIHTIWQVCIMTVASDFINWISNNTNDFWYTETVGWVGNELNVKVYWGRVEDPSDIDAVVVDTTLTLTDDTTNYIYLDDTDNTFKSSITEPETYKVLASVVTAAWAITSITDLRAIKAILWAVPLSLSTTDRLALTNIRAGTIVYDIDLWENFQYISGWRQPISAWSTQPRATNAVEWKVRIATAWEYTAWTDIWVDWATLVPKPSQTKPTAWTGINVSWNQVSVDTSVIATQAYVDGQILTTNNWTKDFVLWENLTASAASPKVVSLMPDGKVYGLTWNKRQYTWNLAWYTTTTSCVLNWWDKIATVWISWNILTLFIGTVNRTTRVITRWVWQQITTDSNNCNIVKVAEDKICVMYKNTSNIIFVRSISIIWTVWTISDAVQIYWASAFTWITAYLNLRDNVVFVNIVLTTSPWTQHFLITFSWNTPTVVAWAGVAMSNNSWFWCNYCKINDEYFWFYNFDWNWNRFQCLRYTTTITYWTVVSRWRFDSSITSDWISLYIAENSATTKLLMKYSFDTTTCNLTQIYATDISSDSVPNYLIKYFNWMIAFWRGWTSLMFYSPWATSATKRNTLNYWIALTWLDKHSDVWNTYLFTAISWNPTTYYEIANENRNIIWLLSSSWNRDDTKTITIDWGISILSGIVPGENYWAVESTGLLDKWTGLLKFGKWLSTTQLKLTINWID